MPNGDPDWRTKELPKLETFFGKISDVLEDFATSHNLTIIKYYHQGRDWTLRFRHPEGGLGQIFVLKKGEDEIGLSSSWQIANYDECTLRSKHTEIKSYQLNDNLLFNRLQKALKEILTWGRDELGKDNIVHPEWKGATKEIFEAEEQSYSVPKID